MSTNLSEDNSPPRILVIDDNPSVHVAFDEILRREPANTKLEEDEAFMFGEPHSPSQAKQTYHIEHALSGAEGIEKVRQSLITKTPYQVAFVDIRMPGIDGVETIERMWALDARIQTVICTAYADYRWEDLSKRLGRTDRLLVLKKPFQGIEVMQLASTLAEKWNLGRVAALKIEQAELLVSQRTQKLLEFQKREQQWIQEFDQTMIRHVLNLAQEFRGPLTVMLHTLENPAPGGALDQPAQQVLERNARTLVRILEDSLQLRQLDAADRQPEWLESDIVRLVRGMVQMFATGVRDRQIKMEFKAAEESRLIWTDSAKLERVLFNLYARAVVSAEEESTVQTQLHFDEKAVHLGIKIHRVKPDSCLAPEHGSGLLLCQEVLRLFGGTLSVETAPLSKSESRSIKILVMLPGAKPEPAESPKLDPAGETAPSVLNHIDKDLPVILLIEENADLRAFIRHGFDSDYCMLEATGAAQGMIDATENVPDLIVVGGKVSNGDEVQLCADFKSNEITSHIPVILLSQDASDTSQVRALKAGVDDVLSLPFRLPVLKARVDNLLENRRKLHEHFQQLQSVQPRELAMNQVDAEFLRRVVEIVEKNLADYEFDMETLARQMAVSRRQLFRKFKALAGSTPNVFIRDIRLKRAAQLLRDSRMTVSEIIYAVGFSDPKYFRNIFRERFGVLPGEYNEQTRRAG
ncbi:MAG: helix-turn-helix domain-containing protein [Verrucomicrobiota bacterium]|jgi:CheY-like chemotaxis protein